jgi:hypothetical protein
MSKPNIKPKIDRQLDGIAAAVRAGRLMPDQGLEKAIAINIAWAARFLSFERRQQLESLLWTLANTDPTLLRLSGHRCLH